MVFRNRTLDVQIGWITFLPFDLALVTTIVTAVTLVEDVGDCPVLLLVIPASSSIGADVG